ncbi:MAG: NAD(P)H-dependent oxidoreductase [Gemmatimonadetes bacterium]|nr:NAD(P)H-dependent oxidoreductase [Gemmatimonadota bacterium]
MHIVALCGSLRGDESFTLKAMKIAVREMLADGATVDLIDLTTLGLPFCSSEEDTDDHPGCAELKDRVRRADGLLLGSPEYHNSFSGVLKNALDLLSAEEVRGKLFGLLGVSGGEAGAINTLGHLRYVVRGIGGWSLPAQISIPNAWKMFDGDRLTDDALNGRLRAFARELVRFSRLHSLAPHFEAGLLQVIDESPDELPGA